MIFRTLRENELEAWVEHCTTVFTGSTDTPEYFRDHFLDDPYRDFDGVFVAEDEGRIVSTVRVFVREIYIGGVRVGMGGIGEVSTQEAYRKRGLSGELLKMAVDYMVRRKLHTSMLFTGVHPHYARYGWFSVPRRFVRPDLRTAPVLPEGYILRRVEENDMAAVRGLYGLSAGRFDGAVVREHPGYWDQWVRRQWKNPVALERGGQMVAYMDIRVDEEKKSLWVRDYATEPEKDWWLSILASYAKSLSDEFGAWVPSRFMPENNGPFVEHKGTMLRLNVPFYVGEKCIDTAAKLAAACTDHLFWDIDDF